MTAAIAYDATSEVPISQFGAERDAAHDLAVVWAVVQLADSMPATIEDRVALEAARSRVRELARTLRTDEIGLKRRLEERYERDIGTHGVPLKHCLRDSDGETRLGLA